MPLQSLLDQMGDGLLVTELMGPGVSMVTGDYSRGASGFRVEGGEITHPVEEVTMAGNLMALSARRVPGSDLEFRGSSNAPSLLIDNVAIAGQ